MNTFSSIVLFLAVIAALIQRPETFEKQFLDPKVRVATDMGKSADFRAFGEGFAKEKGEWKWFLLSMVLTYFDLTQRCWHGSWFICVSIQNVLKRCNLLRRKCMRKLDGKEKKWEFNSWWWRSSLSSGCLLLFALCWTCMTKTNRYWTFVNIVKTRGQLNLEELNKELHQEGGFWGGIQSPCMNGLWMFMKVNAGKPNLYLSEQI